MDFSKNPTVGAEEETQSSVSPVKDLPEFEGYKIINELPRGGQAFVYKAIHKATKLKVALKVLSPGFLASPRACRRFEREVDLISGLKHPYIIRMQDSGVAAGHYYYAMEYIVGLPLNQYVLNEGMPVKDILVLFAKVCDAVAYAHQRGVIHRDLKPANILVDKRGDPHILDFGLAKVAGSLNDTISVITMSGEIQGTLAYMSPEQASGKIDAVDVRTDVYTLGVILFQLLTDLFPYDVSGTTAQILRNVEIAEPTRPRKINTRFGSEVEAIILKCLDKNPARRYHSAAELYDDIQHWLNGEPLVAKSHSSIYVFRKMVSRYRYGAAIVTLLLVIFLSFSVMTMFLYGRTHRAEAEMQKTFIQMRELQQEIGENTIQTAFLNYIEGWQTNNDTQSTLLAGAIMAIGPSKEAKGIHFLEHADQWQHKEGQFKEAFDAKDRWFADLVIGECYRKENDWANALVAYRRSLAAGQQVLGRKVTGDGLLMAFVTSRLQQGSRLQKQNDAIANPAGSGATVQ